MTIGGRIAVVLVAALALGACNPFENMFGDKKIPLPGERISVLSLDRRLEPDPNLAKIPISLPQPVVNPDWPQAGGDPNHMMSRLALPEHLARAWSVSVGEGTSDNTWVMAQPVIAGGRVFAMDGGVAVSAYEATSGKRLWRVDLTPKDQRGHAFGGGLAFDKGQLYAATGYGEVIALDPASGKILWREEVGTPMHSAPTVSAGRILVVTVDNELLALNAKDGHRLWTHSGIPQTADLLGGASPAVTSEIVVVPYSSGELDALTVENGRAVWSENLADTRSINPVASLADIRGRPVIDRDRVFAVSHSGRMMAIDLRSGSRVWEQEIGSAHSPWVAGDYVYALSNDNELVCLTRNEGRVRWVRQLPNYENEKKRKGPIEWAGPVLGGDRLILLSSNGRVLSVSPYTGQPIGQQPIPAGGYLEPAIAGNTLYILTDDATLSAYR
jgi:outer membrane protein assembly factor BamB